MRLLIGLGFGAVDVHVYVFVVFGGHGEGLEPFIGLDCGLFRREWVLGRRKPTVGHGGILGETLLLAIGAYGFDGVGRSAEEVEDESRTLEVGLWGM